MSIQKIVAMCREGGAYAYPIDGRDIAVMVRDGYLGREGNNVWVSREMFVPSLKKETA